MKRESKRMAMLPRQHIGKPDKESEESVRTDRNLGSILKNAVFSRITPDEIAALAILERARPESLRDFDQISMQGADLLCQVKLVAPQLADKNVVFVGDHDGTSLLLGLLHAQGLVEAPSRMTLLDFDERLRKQAQTLASEHGFSDISEARPYNVFHPVPTDLVGWFDVF